MIQLPRTSFYLLCFLLLCSAKTWGGQPSINSDSAAVQSWLQQEHSGEEVLLGEIRKALITGKPLKIQSASSIPFDPAVSVVGVTLFQDGNKPLRYLSKRQTLEKTLNRVVLKLRAQGRFTDFAIDESAKTRILLEVVVKEHSVDLEDISFNRFNSSRFEPGITGLRLKHAQGTNVYYMPTDATVYSHLSRRHVLNAIAKKTPIGRQTKSISGRLKLLRKEPYEYFLTRSVAYISYQDQTLPLYRGYPLPIDTSRQSMYSKTRNATDWLVKNMESNGKFLYYYDGIRDTIVDHDHPKRSPQNLYYNSLRHSGGTITLLRMYELTKDTKYLSAAKKSLQFITDNLRERDMNGEKAYYLFYNSKSKLGGTGIALVAMARYYMLSGDNTYHETMAGMARHLVSRIDAEGEFLGYYIHPAYYHGNPILAPTDTEKKHLFSFYYPGEALMGLALYTREVSQSAQEIQAIKQASRRALDWLVGVRPKKYPELFLSLPADGWLMQAIEEWSLDPDFREQGYYDFVFRDARQMLDNMYKSDSSPYYDYPGSFYYEYGDHGYTDGARAEGLIAAYYLALRLDDRENAEALANGMKSIARSLLFTYNSPESTYMYLHPEKAIGAFRFKYTRQWLRVDSVQHTACFFIRMLLAPGLLEESLKPAD